MPARSNANLAGSRNTNSTRPSKPRSSGTRTTNPGGVPSRAANILNTTKRNTRNESCLSPSPLYSWERVGVRAFLQTQMSNQARSPNSQMTNIAHVDSQAHYSYPSCNSG